MSGGKTLAACIDPDSGDSFTLGSGDVPFEIVADHPRLRRRDAQIAESASIDPGIGLAETNLSLDEDRVEQVRETKSIDLVALALAATVGQQSEPASLLAKPFDRGHGIVEEPDPLVPQRVIRIANLPRQVGVINADIEQRQADDLATRPREIEPADAMTLGIGPVPLPDSVDRLEDDRRVETVHRRLMSETGLPPAGDYAAGVVEDRVVEIEKNGLRQTSLLSLVK